MENLPMTAFGHFLDRLLDNYLWLLGLLLMVEPMLDNTIELYRDWANRYVSRKIRTRTALCLSILAAFVACFLAFRDEYHAAETAISERDTARSQVTDLQNKLTTMVAVAKDRSKYIGPLQNLYTIGSGLQRDIISKIVTDDQIDQSELAVNKWLNSSVSWIQANMTVAAASRFLNNTDKGSYSFALDGQHAQGEKDKRDNILNSLAGCLTNLETLMKSDQWDPR